MDDSPTTAPHWTPITTAMQVLIAAAADPARHAELPALLVAPGLAEAMTLATTTDNELRRLSSKHAEQVEAVAAARSTLAAAKAAHDAALSEHAAAIEDDEITGAAAKVKRAAQAEQRAQQALDAAERLQAAIRSRILGLEAQHAAAREGLRLMDHRHRLAALVADEVRAWIFASAPLLRLASAIAAGSQNHGLASRLSDIKVPDPTGAVHAVLQGTKVTTGEMQPLPGALIDVPVTVDLVDGWRDDPALAAIADAAAVPSTLHLQLGAYKPLEQVEAERAAAEAYANRPKPINRSRNQAPLPAPQSAPAAPPVRPQEGDVNFAMRQRAAHGGSDFAPH